MAHEMGHGADMDARAMARDMRNRFWASLSRCHIPHAPMGMDFIKLSPPFGLELNLWLFLLATGAAPFIPPGPSLSRPRVRFAMACSTWPCSSC